MPAQPLTPEQKADAARLKAIYEAKKGELQLTQASLAALCGWESQGSVSQYLNGKIPLNLDAAAKLARNLECSIADFSKALDSDLRSLGEASKAPPASFIKNAVQQPACPPDQVSFVAAILADLAKTRTPDERQTLERYLLSKSSEWLLERHDKTRPPPASPAPKREASS